MLDHPASTPQEQQTSWQENLWTATVVLAAFALYAAGAARGLRQSEVGGPVVGARTLLLAAVVGAWPLAAG